MSAEGKIVNYPSPTRTQMRRDHIATINNSLSPGQAAIDYVNKKLNVGVDVSVSANGFLTFITQADVTAALAGALAAYLPLAGGQMTGNIGIGAPVLAASTINAIATIPGNGSGIQYVNNDPGVSSRASFNLGNGTSLLTFTMFGVGYTTAGILRADGANIRSFGSGGLTLSTTNTPIYIAPNLVEVARFTSVGLGIGKDPANLLDITQSNAGAALIAIKNPNAGASAVAGMNITTGTTGGFLYQTGASYAVNGAHRPDATVLRSDSPGGLTLLTMVNQPIYIAPNNVEAARFTSTGLSIPVLGQVPFSAAYPLDIRGNSNNPLIVLVQQLGGGGYAQSVVSNGISNLGLMMIGSAYAGAGMYKPDCGVIESSGANGLAVFTDKNAPLIFGVAQAEVARFAISGGGLCIGTPTPVGVVCTMASATVNSYMLYVEATTAAPAGMMIGTFLFTNAAPNNGSNFFFGMSDTGGNRAYFSSNGGLNNFSANNVNLSDMRLKPQIEVLTPIIGELWNAHRETSWSRFKYHDQTHDDWNYGYTAQDVRDKFGSVVPAITEQWRAEGESRDDLLGVYCEDLHNIGHAVLAEAQRRIEALEVRLTQLERTLH